MNKHRWFVNFCVGFVKLTGLLPAWLFFKPRVKRLHRNGSPLSTPCILVSNHTSLLDFVLYLLVFPFHTIRFLMAEVLFNKGKVFAGFLRAIGGIRVDRDTYDFGFVADAIEILDQRGIVGIFPEGRLPQRGKVFPFTVSTAFIALHAPEVPIVPVYTDGNYGLFKRAEVVIGKPVFLADYCQDGLDDAAQLQQLTDRLHNLVYALKEELSE